MRRIVLLVTLSLLAGSLPASSGEKDDLQATVEAQGKLIEELRGEIDEIKQAQGAQRPPDVAAAPAERRPAEVTPEYVDQRIEDYATAPQSRLFLSGYGTAQYRVVDGGANGFGVGFNPIFHFRMSEHLHFSGEFEIGFSRNGSETETDFELEFAQIDYLMTDWLTLSGGSFLTPFNAFGQRLHPTWINKLASKPPIYGGEGEVGIIPVVSQVGAMASGGAPLWSDSAKFNYALYVVNAPTMEREEDAMGVKEDVPLDFDFKSTPPESSKVGYGARVGFLPIPNLEIGVSYQTGEVAGSSDRYNLLGSDLWYLWHGVELRAEYVRLSQEFEDSNPSTQGYYVQASYRLRNMIHDTGDWWGSVGRLEPVVRWGQITDYDPNERKQLALGLNFWLYESVPLKLTYEINSGEVSEDRFSVQFSYGF